MVAEKTWVLVLKLAFEGDQIAKVNHSAEILIETIHDYGKV